MLSPCLNCSPLECVLGQRSKDCLVLYPNLRRIGNSKESFENTNENPNNWLENERQFYYQQIKRKTAMTTKKGRPTKTNPLMDALAFIECGTGNQHSWCEFVKICNGYATSFNGQISAGHLATEELTRAPNFVKTKLALNKCGKSLVISETPGGQLSVKGEKLRALVPCLSFDTLTVVEPDKMVGTANDALKEAFKICGVLASEAGERLIEASLLLDANFCTGTNGHVMLQYWHGINMPSGIVLPKNFTQAIAKQTKKIEGFGFTWDENQKVKTFTVWFEEKCWIKTQCYADDWPVAVHEVINAPSNPLPTLSGFFEAALAVSDFSDDGTVTFGTDEMMSHDHDMLGAQYKVKGLQSGKKFNGDYLKKIAPFVKTIDLTTYDDKAYFFGGEPANPIRGAVMGLKTHDTEILGDYNIDGNT